MPGELNWSSSTAAGSDHDHDCGHETWHNNIDPGESMGQGQADAATPAAATCPPGAAAAVVQQPANDVPAKDSGTTLDKTPSTTAGTGSRPEATRVAYSDGTFSQSSNPEHCVGHHYCSKCGEWSRGNVCQRCCAAQYLERQRDRCPFGCGERLNLMDDWARHKHLLKCEMRNFFVRKKLRSN